MLIYLLIIVAATIVIGQLALAWQARRSTGEDHGDTTSNYQPMLSVILPVKGPAADLGEMIDRLMDQEYSRYEVIVSCLADEDDIIRLIAQKQVEWDSADRHLRCVISPQAQRCGQKMLQQVTAAEQAAHDSTVLVFADADARWHRQVLSRLVAPLQDPTVGCTTGYRWYEPVAGSIASAARAAWNAPTLMFMAGRHCAHAWGGCMAIPRHIFERDIKDHWLRSLSDDQTIRSLLAAQGLRIVFQSGCLLPNHSTMTWRQWWEFSTRQTHIIKLYTPALYRSCIIRFGLIAWVLALGIIAWIGSGSFVALVAGLSPLVALQLSVVMMIAPVRRMLADEPQAARVCSIAMLAVIPLVALGFGLTVLALWRRDSLSWSGITYRLQSPFDIEVDTTVATPMELH